MPNKWSTYNQIIPDIDCFEVNLGYVNNRVFSLDDNGGLFVSKLFSLATSEIFYVERSLVASNIDIYGNYTP